MLLTIERETFIIPPGKDIASVLDALSGLRRVEERYFHNIEPYRHVVRDVGEAEVTVAVLRREFVDEDEFQKVKEADDAARVALQGKAAAAS